MSKERSILLEKSRKEVQACCDALLQRTDDQFDCNVKQFARKLDRFIEATRTPDGKDLSPSPAKPGHIQVTSVLLKLPMELKDAILAELLRVATIDGEDTASKTDVCSLRLVNRAMKELATPHLYRSLRLRLRIPQFSRDLDMLNPKFLSHICFWDVSILEHAYGQLHPLVHRLYVNLHTFFCFCLNVKFISVNTNEEWVENALWDNNNFFGPSIRQLELKSYSPNNTDPDNFSKLVSRCPNTCYVRLLICNAGWNRFPELGLAVASLPRLKMLQLDHIYPTLLFSSLEFEWRDRLTGLHLSSMNQRRLPEIISFIQQHANTLEKLTLYNIYQTFSVPVHTPASLFTLEVPPASDEILGFELPRLHTLCLERSSINTMKLFYKYSGETLILNDCLPFSSLESWFQQLGETGKLKKLILQNCSNIVPFTKFCSSHGFVCLERP